VVGGEQIPYKYRTRNQGLGIISIGLEDRVTVGLGFSTKIPYFQDWDSFSKSIGHALRQVNHLFLLIFLSDSLWSST
jgi:hypothetical protein